MASRAPSLGTASLGLWLASRCVAAFSPIGAERSITANAEGLNPGGQAPLVVQQTAEGQGLGLWEESLFSFAPGGHSSGLAESSQESGWLLSSFFADGRAYAAARRVVQTWVGMSDASSIARFQFEVQEPTLVALRATVSIAFDHVPADQLLFNAHSMVSLALADGTIIEHIATAAGGPRAEPTSVDRTLLLEPGVYEILGIADAFHASDAARTESTESRFSFALTVLPSPSAGLAPLAAAFALARRRRGL